jgi:hypothetical protein
MSAEEYFKQLEFIAIRFKRIKLRENKRVLLRKEGFSLSEQNKILENNFVNNEEKLKLWQRLE